MALCVKVRMEHSDHDVAMFWHITRFVDGI